MWTCQKCGKPVYFAERKQSMGFSWHPDCLRCEECGKRLNPGQHADHKGSPFCHVPCYSALFGPQLFGHGSKVESHSSFGKGRVSSPTINKGHLESKVKLYNRVWDGKRGELNVREVNGRLVLEGVLRIYWSVSKEIHLKEDDDRRIWVQVKKRQSYRKVIENSDRKSLQLFDAPENMNPPDANRVTSLPFNSLPSGFDLKAWRDAIQEISDEQGGAQPSIDDGMKTLPTRLSICSAPEPLTSEALKDANHVNNNVDQISDSEDEDMTVRVAKVPLRRRPGRKMVRSPLKRRKSMINGHCYDVTTSTFTPPRGCCASVWVSSLVTTSEVINMLLEKYKVQSPAENFGLYAVWDNGEQREVKNTAYPLMERVMLGPHEDVVKLFIMDRERGTEIPQEVAQYLKFSVTELSMFLEAFYDEEEREVARIQTKYRNEKYLVQRRMTQEKQKMLAKEAREANNVTASVKL